MGKNDPVPKGKKREPSPREKEKQIQADLFDRIATHGGNYTVIELVERKPKTPLVRASGLPTILPILQRKA